LDSIEVMSRSEYEVRSVGQKYSASQCRDKKLTSVAIDCKLAAVVTSQRTVNCRAALPEVGLAVTTFHVTRDNGIWHPVDHISLSSSATIVHEKYTVTVSVTFVV